MTTCRDIVSYALRQAKIISPGDEASADELADGMVALQSFYDGLVSDGMFGRLTQRYEATDYEAGEGQLVIAPAGVVITYPTTIDDCDGERVPRDLSVIETVVDGQRTLKIWDRSGWVPLLELAPESAAPLAGRGAWALAAAVAISGAFVGMFGDTVGPDVRRLAMQFMRSLSLKYGVDRQPAAGEYF